MGEVSSSAFDDPVGSDRPYVPTELPWRGDGSGARPRPGDGTGGWDRDADLVVDPDELRATAEALGKVASDLRRVDLERLEVPAEQVGHQAMADALAKVASWQGAQLAGLARELDGFADDLRRHTDQVSTIEDDIRRRMDTALSGLDSADNYDGGGYHGTNGGGSYGTYGSSGSAGWYGSGYSGHGGVGGLGQRTGW